ncbi:MAG: hypothetical protein VX000_17570, partial [Myxococcota bacterium]|nr:hypothetical protein [Myxococcota bacterium]
MLPSLLLLSLLPTADATFCKSSLRTYDGLYNGQSAYTESNYRRCVASHQQCEATASQNEGCDNVWRDCAEQKADCQLILNGIQAAEQARREQAARQRLQPAAPTYDAFDEEEDWDDEEARQNFDTASLSAAPSAPEPDLDDALAQDWEDPLAAGLDATDDDEFLAIGLAVLGVG